ncbi:DUF3100 domain-containing protein [Vibrio nitrifigilis]|uniref:DUF3100 domain-containing protein n=1 Tax=Vibrio nitrifigilis TaxID=2789781 RepID=A0ABS0GJ70_9VIBR|nr:DUF3100 domain-containing protein [Vibrio nitrifigilis]MBF9002506.1 DUF3100 domain-containing protein [Vibrio nitrifigilis]
MKDTEYSIKQVLTDWRLMSTALIVVVISEWIGIIPVKFGGWLSLTLFPMLYAMVLGSVAFFAKLLSIEQSEKAQKIVFVAILPLVAKLGMSIGPALPELKNMGLAIVLQEFGNMGTILLALPIGLLLGFKRELIGMTHSIGREANVSLIAERYGINSAEGRGVMTVYIVGTVFGTLFYGLMVPVFVKIPGIHVESWALASGVGSGSLMAAASGSLANVFPQEADKIIAYAGASQVLTSATGLYMAIFILLPFTNWMYKRLSPYGENKPAVSQATRVK